jgi:Ca-activated chloride channel family protein
VRFAARRFVIYFADSLRGFMQFRPLRCRLIVFAILISAAAFVSAFAQQSKKSPPIESDDVIRIDTDLVTFDATVTDALGHPVRNLRAEDFKVYEDGEERPISFFHLEQRGSGVRRPVAVVFALDISGSMTPEELHRLSSAMRVFVNELARERASLFAVMTFGMRVHVLQNFTNDQQKLERTFMRLEHETDGLSTHAYDAVDDAIRLLNRHAPRARDSRLMKRAVVVITDGFPVGDTVKPNTVIERANASDVSVYTVTLPSYSHLLMPVSHEDAPLPTPLDVSGLVEKTGGINVYAVGTNFEPLFRALAEEVTSSYVLAFYPPESKRHDGQMHTIRIEAPKGLRVRQSRDAYKSEKQ